MVKLSLSFSERYPINFLFKILLEVTQQLNKMCQHRQNEKLLNKAKETNGFGFVLIVDSAGQRRCARTGINNAENLFFSPHDQPPLVLFH